MKPQPGRSVTADKSAYWDLLDLLVYGELERATFLEVEELPEDFSPSEGWHILWDGPILTLDWKARLEDIEEAFQNQTRSVIPNLDLGMLDPNATYMSVQATLSEILFSHGLSIISINFGNDSFDLAVCKHEDVTTVMAILLKIFPDQDFVGNGDAFTPGSQKAKAYATGLTPASSAEAARVYALETIAYKRPLFEQLLDLIVFYEDSDQTGSARAKVAALSPGQDKEELLVGPAGPIIGLRWGNVHGWIEGAFRAAVQARVSDFSIRPLHADHDDPLAVHATLNEALARSGLRSVELAFWDDVQRKFVICKDGDVYLVAALLMQIFPGRAEIKLGYTPGSEEALTLASGPALPWETFS